MNQGQEIHYDVTMQVFIGGQGVEGDNYLTLILQLQIIH